MYPTKPNNQKQKMIAAFVVIAAVVLVAVGVSAFTKNSHGSTMSGTTASGTPPASSTAGTAMGSASGSSATNTSASYKDGSYTASSDYYVPHGYENIRVALTVKNGVVTSSDVNNSESDPESASFQEDFADEYKSYVVGKRLSSIHLPYIAGASDTTQGFNDALQQIESQAQA